MLDLFSGVGGASESFIHDQKWSVLRIDNNPLLSGVPYTIIDDIQNVENNVITWKANNPKIDLIWASPPCLDFSNAFASPKSKHVRDHGIDSYEPNMELLESALVVIEKLNPKYFVIENVVGATRYFNKILGEPRQIIGPYVLWGNFPFLEIDKSALQSKAKKDVHSSNPLRSNYKAKVDFEISRALKEAIENQTSILDF